MEERPDVIAIQHPLKQTLPVFHHILAVLCCGGLFSVVLGIIDLLVFQILLAACYRTGVSLSQKPVVEVPQVIPLLCFPSLIHFKSKTANLPGPFSPF